MRRGVLAALAAVLAFAMGCSEPEPQPDPQPQPTRNIDDDDQQHLSGKLKVYTVYKPQVQRRNFNGVFNIAPQGRGSSVVHRYWKRRFAELTRPGFYGEFFIEFYDYMSFLAQGYDADSVMKESILNSLEKSFRLFCKVMGVDEEFEEFQIERQKLIGDG